MKHKKKRNIQIKVNEAKIEFLPNYIESETDTLAYI